MTIQTHVLEARLGQLQAKVQRLLASEPTANAFEVADCWRALDSADFELSQALRQFEAVEPERAALLGGQVDAAVKNDLLRVLNRAGFLATAIIELSRRSDDLSSVDLTHAICHIATQMGKSLDHLMVRLTVQKFRTQPLWVSTFAATNGANAHEGSVSETVFVAIGMVLALIRGRRARGR
jgi:hypothetical protein